MKRITTIITIGLLSLAASSFISADKWHLVDATNFSIEFPGKPEKGKENVKTEVGKLTMEMLTYDATKVKGDDNLVYSMITTDYPEDMVTSTNTEMLPAFFDGAISGAVGNVKGSLLSQEEVEISGYPGRKVRINYKEGIAVITMHAYLVKNRMYILQTICVTDNDGNADSKRFFESFKLKV